MNKQSVNLTFRSNMFITKSIQDLSCLKFGIIFYQSTINGYNEITKLCYNNYTLNTSLFDRTIIGKELYISVYSFEKSVIMNVHALISLSKCKGINIDIRKYSKRCSISHNSKHCSSYLKSISNGELKASHSHHAIASWEHKLHYLFTDNNTCTVIMFDLLPFEGLYVSTFPHKLELNLPYPKDHNNVHVEVKGNLERDDGVNLREIITKGNIKFFQEELVQSDTLCSNTTAAQAHSLEDVSNYMQKQSSNKRPFMYFCFNAKYDSIKSNDNSILVVLNELFTSWVTVQLTLHNCYNPIIYKDNINNGKQVNCLWTLPLSIYYNSSDQICLQQTRNANDFGKDLILTLHGADTLQKPCDVGVIQTEINYCFQVEVEIYIKNLCCELV